MEGLLGGEVWPTALVVMAPLEWRPTLPATSLRPSVVKSVTSPNIGCHPPPVLGLVTHLRRKLMEIRDNKPVSLF